MFLIFGGIDFVGHSKKFLMFLRLLFCPMVDRTDVIWKLLCSFEKEAYV